MKTSKHVHFLFGNNVEQSIRKFSQHHASNLPKNRLILQGMPFDRGESRLDRLQEFLSNRLCLLIVPNRSVHDFRLGLRLDDKLHLKRARKRSRTSSHGIARLGSRSCSAMRRSISCICSGVSGGSSTSSTLSHSS